MLVFEHQLMGFRYPLETEVAPKHWTDLTALDQLVGLHALVRVSEVGPQDLLLLHPQVAHVEVQVKASGARAAHDLPERLHSEHRCGECRLPDMLEDDVGSVAKDLLHALCEF